MLVDLDPSAGAQTTCSPGPMMRGTMLVMTHLHALKLALSISL